MHACPPTRISGGGMGVVFQDFRLVPHLSAFDNVALPLRVSGSARGKAIIAEKPVADMLAWVGFGDRSEGASRPRRSRAGSSSAWRLPARSSAGPTCWWRTSRPVTSMPEMALKRLIALFEALNRLGNHGSGRDARSATCSGRSCRNALMMRIDKGRLIRSHRAHCAYPPRRPRCATTAGPA
jgi:cell division transport system ATP-binding protein